MSQEPARIRQDGNAAVALPLDALLAARTVWRAGHAVNLIIPALYLPKVEGGLLQVIIHHFRTQIRPS